MSPQATPGMSAQPTPHPTPPPVAAAACQTPSEPAVSAMIDLTSQPPATTTSQTDSKPAGKLKGLVKPEVLSPVGGWPQLRAAVENGADACYFGLSDFSARAR